LWEELLMKKRHFAELLLDVKLHGPADRFRGRRPFSPDIAATHAVLFDSRYKKREKIRAYREWLEHGQPCVFGKVAAKNKNVFICLLEESDVLRMRHGDEDLRATIQDYRQAWKRHALDGLSSSFLILLVSRSLVEKEPSADLKEVCRRLMELYMELDRIDDDAFHGQREYVFLRQHVDGKTRLLEQHLANVPSLLVAHHGPVSRP
jgi:hypothetical protein